MILTAKRHKGWAAIVLAGAAFLGYEIGGSISSNSDQIDAVRDAQVGACRASLRPGGVRYILAQQIEGQIEQSRAISPSFFPNIPLKTFHQLVHQQNAERQAEIAQLRNVDCAKQFARP